jgi:hypothetical protein
MRQLTVASGVGKAHLARLLLIARAVGRAGLGGDVRHRRRQQPRLAADEGFQTFVLPEADVSDFSK